MHDRSPRHKFDTSGKTSDDATSVCVLKNEQRQDVLRGCNMLRVCHHATCYFFFARRSEGRIPLMKRCESSRQRRRGGRLICRRPSCPISSLHIAKGKSTTHQPVRYNRATTEPTAAPTPRIERPPKQGPTVRAGHMTRGVFISYDESRIHMT
jgi:hypothetical protein